MRTGTLLKAPKAPTASEASDLECTHISCGVCDATEEWPAGQKLGAWSCEWCGDEESPVFEHHSPAPLGYRDDKACHWGGYIPALTGARVPDVWIYYSMPPEVLA